MKKIILRTTDAEIVITGFGKIRISKAKNMIGEKFDWKEGIDISLHPKWHYKGEVGNHTEMIVNGGSGATWHRKLVRHRGTKN